MAQVTFNPDQVAYYEAAGWRAYYDRQWFRLMRLILALSHEQFHIPFPRSLLAAYYVTRAAAAWSSVHHDEKKVLHYYRKFYELARQYSGLTFDPAKAAVLELKYNDIHRKLAGKPDKTEFIATLMQLHSEIFGITPKQARESAELRVQANNTVDLITSKTSTDPEADWQKLEEYLRQCYRSIERERQGDLIH